MPIRESVKTGSELFIVDNSDYEWKVVHYLHDWCELSKAIDIATGFFEIGALLSLDGEWQKVDKVRILMGDVVSLRTHDAFQTAFDRIVAHLNESLEQTKEKNPFLNGTTAVVEALREFRGHMTYLNSCNRSGAARNSPGTGLKNEADLSLFEKPACVKFIPRDSNGR